MEIKRHLRKADIMDFLYGAVSEQCSSRSHVNQDNFGAVLTVDSNDRKVLTGVVCDGVSMSYRSEIASYNTILSILRWAERYFPENIFDSNQIMNEIDRELKICNDIINDFSSKFANDDYSCCTVSGIVTDGNEIVTFNAGDSRIYEIDMHDEKLYLLTNDDKAEDGHSISMCMGAFESNELKITFGKHKFLDGNVYLLCTDGMYRRQNFKKWGKNLSEAESRDMIIECLSNILNEVRELGETDDVTSLAIISK